MRRAASHDEAEKFPGPPSESFAEAHLIRLSGSRCASSKCPLSLMEPLAPSSKVVEVQRLRVDEDASEEAAQPDVVARPPTPPTPGLPRRRRRRPVDSAADAADAADAAPSPPPAAPRHSSPPAAAFVATSAARRRAGPGRRPSTTRASTS